MANEPHQAVATERARRRVGGRRLRVSIEGVPRQGVAPLLLINGVGAPLELFEPLREALGDRLTVAFDVPGVGGSPTPLLPPTMGGLARTVAGLLTDVSHELAGEVGTDRMDVLGLSWGGALAQELAHSHPRLVRRLILAATMPGVVCVPGHPVVLAVMASPARYYSPGFLRAVAPLLYGQEVRIHREAFERHLAARTTMAPDPVGYAYQVSALARWTSLPWLCQLNQPTLVLAGDKDAVVPLANARLLAHAIPGARLHVERGGGHLFLLLRAGELAPRIESFLQEPTG